MHRFLPFLLLIVLVLTIYLYLPFRREILYKFHLAGDTTTSCCKIEKLSKGAFDENANLAIFEGQIIDYPKTSLAQAYMNEIYQEQVVLGTTTPSGKEKWIEVSLDQQKLRAFEGNNVVMEFPISSGKWSPTPSGTFHIWYKTRAQKMEGGSSALGTYYNLPNVPNNMFFYQGYAIHGAYWHNNFGRPMSHGCVNSPLASAAQLFEWAGPIVPPGQNYARATSENPGTKVWVH